MEPENIRKGMLMNEIVSVIVPAYRVEQYLTRCVESILAQTYPHLEVILVDDGSPDGSGALCDALAARDERIKVIHKENGGLSDARNAGIEAATGEYLMFVDGDDYIAPDMALKLLAAMTESGADAAICNFRLVADDPDDGTYEAKNTDLPIRDEVISGRAVLEEKLLGPKSWYWVIACNKLYKKSIFKEVRFPVGKLHEDEFSLFDIMSRCERLACVPDMLYCYVQREGSIMQQKYSVRRLDAVEALLLRAKKLIAGAFSKESIACALNSAMGCMNGMFRRKLHKEAPYKARYRELALQYREIGFFKILSYMTGIKKKLHAAMNYVSPYYTWKIAKVKARLRRVGHSAE